MKQFTVSFEITEQVSEDHWKTTHPSMIADETTTLAEVEKFFRKYHYTSFTEVLITELQEPTKVIDL